MATKAVLSEGEYLRTSFPGVVQVSIHRHRDTLAGRSLAEVRNKLQEYADWGVAHVWLIDPHMKRLYLCRDGLHEVPSYQLPEIKLSVTPADLFD
ncbi:MAG: Uma2 family endonuclease [Acidobacteria bacterium]|nr:Uma2 family endonuclease [Acidobacteriota bacterium]